MCKKCHRGYTIVTKQLTLRVWFDFAPCLCINKSFWCDNVKNKKVFEYFYTKLSPAIKMFVNKVLSCKNIWFFCNKYHSYLNLFKSQKLDSS